MVIIQIPNDYENVEFFSSSGWISLASALPNVDEYEFQLVVVATDLGIPAKRTNTRVRFIVTGTNQFAPQFTTNFYRANVAEDVRIGHSLLTTTATDKDVGANGIVQYAIVGGNEGGQFSIDPLKGVIIVNGSLDFETTNFYNLTIVASDLAVQSKFDLAYVSVTISDANDNPPVFFANVMSASVAENMPSGTLVYQLRATDVDTEANAKIIFDIVSGNELGLFRIQPDSGLIKTAANLDYEAHDNYVLKVKASNPGTNLSSQAFLTVNVVSVNEFPPKFQQNVYNFTTSQSARVGYNVGILVATDEDSGPDGQLFYYLTADTQQLGFHINPLSGVISVDSSLGRVTNGTIMITAIVKNRWTLANEHNPLTDLFDEAQVRVTLELTPPQPTFAREKYTSRVSENSPIGTSVLGMSAYSTSGAEIQYKLIEGNDLKAFAIDVTNGLLHVNGLIDRERKDFYNLTVLAFEKVMPTVATATSVLLEISDVNDNPPILPREESIAYVTENEPAGLAIMTLKPTDADLPPSQGPFQFQLAVKEDQRLFELNSATGVLRTKVAFDREIQEEYRLQIQLTDSGNPRQTSTTDLFVRIRDVNDMPSKPRSAVVRVVTTDSHFITERIALLKPSDLDEFGSYECRSVSGFAYNLNSDCWLESTASHSLPAPFELSVSGWDGVHNRVDSNFSVNFMQLSNSTLQNSLDLYINVDRRHIVNDVFNSIQNLARQRGIEVDLISVETIGRLDDIYAPLKRPHVVSLALRRLGGDILSTDRAKQTLKELISSSNSFNVTDIVDNLCEPNRCRNNGTCRMDVYSDLSANYTVVESDLTIYAFRPIKRSWHCQCPFAFAGETCELPVDHCANNPCRNSGTCLFDSDGLVKCLCPKGFAGPTCLEDINECENRSICENGGYCENTRGSFRCICLVGFTGTQCQVAVNYCAETPCKNGGECVGRIDGFTCKCPFGFSGKNCDRGSLGFDENSFVELPALEAQENLINFEFSTTGRDGLLLYSYSPTGDNKDYLSVDIVDGRLRLSAKFANQEATNLILQRPVSNGHWYQVHISHSHQMMGLSVGECLDGEPTCQQCLVGDSSCRLSANIGLQYVYHSVFEFHDTKTDSFYFQTFTHSWQSHLFGWSQILCRSPQPSRSSFCL